MLNGKTVVIGITGSIAAYKIADLVSQLIKLRADVHVIMTENATHFINPITFETLTNNKCLIDTFDRNFEFHVEHISLAKKADVFMIAPASANIIGKIANGIADDMLTTTIMAAKCKKLIAPAMNTNMFENPIVQDNISKLIHYGYEIIAPESGRLACGDTGSGKLASPSLLLSYLLKEIAFSKDLLGKNILVSAGATRESIDPVRFISNHSTGKMGIAIANACMLRGANVTLVGANLAVSIPAFINFMPVTDAKSMFDTITAISNEQDIIIKAAAVSDYTPSVYFDEKVKKKDADLSIPLSRTTDILAFLGSNKRSNQVLCGFSMETEQLIENSKQKLIAKNLDLIIANNLKTPGAGFGTDTNIVTLITKESIQELPILTKDEVAHKIIDAILRL